MSAAAIAERYAGDGPIDARYLCHGGNRVDLTLSGQARNEGALQSLTDLTLSTGGAFENSGTLAANHDATLRIGGALTNGGRLQGDNGATLALSGTLTNSSGGEIVSW